MTNYKPSFPYCMALDRAEVTHALRNSPTFTHAEIADHCGFAANEGMKPREIAAALRAPSYRVSQYLSIARGLSEDLKLRLHQGRISFGHARALARIQDEKRQADLGARAARGQLSVRDLEAAASGQDNRLTPEDRAYYARLGNHIAEQKGHPATIIPETRTSGSITFRYENLEMFDALCSWWKINLDEF